MELKNYYWYFEKALSNRFCEDLINYGNQKKEELGFITKVSSDEFNKLNKKEKKLKIKDLKDIRDSNVAWLNDKWIYDMIQPYIHEANKNAGWNFDWDYSETCQFTKYKLNQYYNWHCDSFNEPYNNTADSNYHGKIRKLSVTCSLSDPKDYKGGKLQFDFRNSVDGKPNIKTCKEILPKGSIVVFPSFVWHRVTPITKGTRYSLVIWNLGYPFK